MYSSLSSLQLGYDPASSSYPPWLADQPFACLLPSVVAPGAVLATVSMTVGEEYGEKRGGRGRGVGFWGEEERWKEREWKMRGKEEGGREFHELLF